jgi:predicted TIM-barrel fold metal-dependent hydrolase
MTSELDSPVFDGDNHLHETRDALTAYLPAEYKSAIRYAEVDGRTKIATKGQISESLDHLLFGFDFPHPEGFKEPLSYLDELDGLTNDQKARVMGGNLTKLMRVDA